MENKLYNQEKVVIGIHAITETIKSCDLNFMEAHQALKALNASYDAELKRRIKDLEESPHKEG